MLCYLQVVQLCYMISGLLPNREDANEEIDRTVVECVFMVVGDHIHTMCERN